VAFPVSSATKIAANVGVDFAHGIKLSPHIRLKYAGISIIGTLSGVIITALLGKRS
jgi:hypothetical protein